MTSTFLESCCDKFLLPIYIMEVPQIQFSIDVGLSISWTRLLTCHSCASGVWSCFQPIDVGHPALECALCCARLGLWHVENRSLFGVFQFLDQAVDVPVVVHVLVCARRKLWRSRSCSSSLWVVQFLEKVVDVPVVVHVF